MSTLHSCPRFLQCVGRFLLCVGRFLQCVAYLQLRLHVVDQTGVDTATVSGNLYLQLVEENDVPSSPVLGATSRAHSSPRFLQCVYRFFQCVAYFQLRFHVVDQTGIDTAAV